MKTRLVTHTLLGLSLVVPWLLGGCSQQNAGGSNPLLGAANAEPANSETNVALITPATTNLPVAELEAAASAPDVTNAPTTVQTNAPVLASATPGTGSVTELKPPPNVHLSPSLAEVVKLTQSGVDQTVLLTFITNTTGVFSLGADEIVYLNDLGVPGDTITIMMQHDQALRNLRMSAVQEYAAAAKAVATPVAPAEEPAASAPAYIDAPAMEVEPAYVSDSYFYDTLAPYGSWVYVAGYGRCWRPTVCISNPGWRPYCDRGRWVYSDCGWYWMSDYSWGGTTFHYGRWFNAPSVGWCWWPDNVWAPSWVSWRYTSDYCGWAPLPPTACYQSGFGLMYQNGSVADGFGFGLGFGSYAFVPWGNFCGPRPSQHCLPPSYAAQVYATATPLNRFEAGGRGQVYNRGIAPERVREYSRAEVRTVSIQDNKPGRGTRTERLERDGRTLAVHRPNLVPGNVEDGNKRQPGGRSSSPGANEVVISKTPQQPGPTAPSIAGRTEVRTDRNRGNVGRPVDQIVSPLVPSISPAAETKSPVTTPTRVETRPVRERQQQLETVTASPTPGISPFGGRPTDVAPTPVTAVTPTPKPLQPRAIQVTPQAAPRPTAPAPSSSVVIIGGKNNNARSGGRDYSVYSTPSPSPTPSAPTSSPRDNFTRPASSPNVTAPQVAENYPAPVNRAQTERSLPNRGESSRPQNRSSYQTYPTPSPGAQVSTPAARPAATPGFTPRSVPSSPAPSFTSRPAPAAAPSAARVESRPAPSGPPVSAPAQPAPSPGRPNR